MQIKHNTSKWVEERKRYELKQERAQKNKKKVKDLKGMQ